MREIDGVWDEAVEGKVRAALLGTHRSYAAAMADRVKAALDRCAAAWSRMRAEACRDARHADQGKGRTLLLLREGCLTRQRGELRALTEVLAAGPDMDDALAARVWAALVFRVGAQQQRTDEATTPPAAGMRLTWPRRPAGSRSMDRLGQ